MSYDRADEDPKRALIDLVALIKVNRSPLLALERGIEELVRVWQTHLVFFNQTFIIQRINPLKSKEQGKNEGIVE